METAVAKTTVDERIAQDVAQFDPAAAKLERFRDYLTYKVNGPQDKDGMKMVREARLEVKGERVSLEKLRKAFVDDAVKYQAGINSKARTYREEMERIEAHLQAEEDKETQWKKEAEEAAARAIQQRIDGRKEWLFGMGLTWNGRAFASHLPGVPEVSEAQVTGLNDGPFEELCGQVKDAVSKATEEAARAAAALAEQARKDKEERERQAAIAEENARKADELKAKEDALNAQVDFARGNELLALGLDVSEFPRAELHTYAAAEWPDVVAKMKTYVDAKHEAARKEQERLAKLEEERIAREAQERKEREERIAAEAAQRERERIEREAKEKQEAEERAELERKQAAAKLSDRKKLQAYVDALLEVEAPEMQGAEAKHAVKHLRTYLTEYRSAKI